MTGPPPMHRQCATTIHVMDLAEGSRPSCSPRRPSTFILNLGAAARAIRCLELVGHAL